MYMHMYLLAHVCKYMYRGINEKFSLGLASGLPEISVGKSHDKLGSTTWIRSGIRRTGF